MGFNNCLEIKLIELNSYKILMLYEVGHHQKKWIEHVEAGMHLLL